MTTARELLQEARKILEHASPSPGWVPDFDDAILRIDAYLAQPEPEPVFWTAREIETGDFETSAEVHCSKPDFDAGEGWEWVPLYTAQPEPAAPELDKQANRAEAVADFDAWFTAEYAAGAPDEREWARVGWNAAKGKATIDAAIAAPFRTIMDMSDEIEFGDGMDDAKPEPSAEVELVKLARERIDDSQRTHWEGCERDHRECLIQRMADTLERLARERDEAVEIVSTLRLIEQEIDEYKLRAEAAERDVATLNVTISDLLANNLMLMTENESLKQRLAVANDH